MNLFCLYFFHFGPWLIKNLAPTVRANKSFVKRIATYFLFTFKTFVCCHFNLSNMYLMQIFYCILNIAKFLLKAFLLQVYCRRGIFVLFSVLFLLLLILPLQTFHILIQIFLRILIFLILLAFCDLFYMGLPGFEPESSGPKPERLPNYPTAP